MTIQQIIRNCLTTDPQTIAGDYTVFFSGSKSGALNEGVLLFTSVDLPKSTIDRIEYRLVSILILLVNIEEYRQEQENQQNFEIVLDEGFSNSTSVDAEELISALERRGIASSLAQELVMGPQARTSQLS